MVCVIKIGVQGDDACHCVWEIERYDGREIKEAQSLTGHTHPYSTGYKAPTLFRINKLENQQAIRYLIS